MNKDYPGVTTRHKFENPREMIKNIVDFIDQHEGNVTIEVMHNPKRFLIGFLCVEADVVWYCSARLLKRKEYRDCHSIIFDRSDGIIRYGKHKFFERMRKVAADGRTKEDSCSNR